MRGLGRRGKFILAELEEGWLGIHLGMTGSVPIVESAEPRHKFAHNVLALDDGRELRFVDPRKLGGLWLAGDVEEIAGGLGVEPLGPAFTVEALERLLAGRTAPVKPLLMDQRLIAGVGNIYADEALIRAGVSPLRSAKSLSAGDVAGVHAGLVEALELAVERLTSLGTSGKPPHRPRRHPRLTSSCPGRSAPPAAAVAPPSPAPSSAPAAPTTASPARRSGGPADSNLSPPARDRERAHLKPLSLWECIDRGHH